jgi:hypothetical protein
MTLGTAQLKKLGARSRGIGIAFQRIAPPNSILWSPLTVRRRPNDPYLEQRTLLSAQSHEKQPTPGSPTPPESFSHDL